MQPIELLPNGLLQIQSLLLLTAEALRDHLREVRLRVIGLKQELINRLREYYLSVFIESNEVFPTVCLPLGKYFFERFYKTL